MWGKVRWQDSPYKRIHQTTSLRPIPRRSSNRSAAHDRDRKVGKITLNTKSVMAGSANPVLKIELSESTKQLLDQLPKESYWDDFPLYKFEGFWLCAPRIQAALAMQSHFKAHDDDIIVASSVKTGSTWLKALCTSIMHGPCSEIKGDHEDLLVKNHPSVYVKTLESQVYTSNPSPDLSGMLSPRLFHSHLPYSFLPDSIKESEHCKIVYITRNPKDTFVSFWHFLNSWKPEQGPYPLEEAFEKFCNGVCPFGPFFDHVLEYWKESLKRPQKILFLKYEELKRDPKEEVKRLAEFLGRPFFKEEIDDLIKRCSMERLKNLEVNKNGVDPFIKMPTSAFFRRGIVGDWKNNLTMEMADQLDQLTRLKFEGSGLDLEI